MGGGFAHDAGDLVAGGVVAEFWDVVADGLIVLVVVFSGSFNAGNPVTPVTLAAA